VGEEKKYESAREGGGSAKTNRTPATGKKPQQQVRTRKKREFFLGTKNGRASPPGKKIPKDHGERGKKPHQIPKSKEGGVVSAFSGKQNLRQRGGKGSIRSQKSWPLRHLVSLVK